MARLWANFPPRGSSDGDRLVALETIWGELSRSTWLTDAVWADGVSLMLRGHATYMPTIRQMLEACIEAEREIDKAAGTDEASMAIGRVDATRLLATVKDAPEAVSPMAAAIRSGVWDRTTARTIAWGRLRQERYDQLVTEAERALPVDLPYRKRREIARTRAGYGFADYQPEVTDDHIAEILHEMAQPRPKERGGIPPLRGTLEAAMAARIEG